MAVETTDIKTALLACNGSVTTFPFSFPILATGDLKVYLITNATEAKELLTETTDYSVNATNDDYSSGGNVETVATYSSNYSILIVRDVTNTQTTDYTVGDDLDADVLESDFDRRTMVAQEFEERLSRMLFFPVQDPTTISGEMAPQADRLGKYLYFDATYGEPTMVDAISTGTTTITDFAKTLLDDTDADTWIATLLATSDADTTIASFLAGLTAVGKEAWRTGLTSIKVIADAPYTVLDDDGFTDFFYDLVTANRGLILPVAANNPGREIFAKIRTNTSGTLLVAGQGGNLINGIATWQLGGAGDWIRLFCDGSDWHVKGHYESDLEYSHDADFTQAAAAQNTWYKITNFELALPTGGTWEIEFLTHSYTSLSAKNVEITCADGAASEDDDIYTSWLNSTSSHEMFPTTRCFRRIFASAVTLHMNIRTVTAGTPDIYANDAAGHGYLRAKRVN